MHRNVRRNFTKNTVQVSFQDFFCAATKPPLWPLLHVSREEREYLDQVFRQNMGIATAHMGLLLVVLNLVIH